MMKLILIVTLVWLRMNLSYKVVRTPYLWVLPTITLYVCQFVLKMVFDTDSVQDSILEDIGSCSNSNKPSEFQKIGSIFLTAYVMFMEDMHTCTAYIPPCGYHFKN